MPFVTPLQTFDRLERAQSAWTKGGAIVDVNESGARGATHAHFRLDLDGAGGATLRAQTPDEGRSAATDQVFFLRGAALVGIDNIAKERLLRPAPDRGSVGLRFTAVLGGLNDAIGFLSSPEVRTRYLTPFRALDGWKATPTTLSRRTTATGKESYTRLDFDGSGRLKALHVELPGSRTDWRIAYTDRRVASIPKGYRLVDAFTARPRPPRFADARAKAAVGRTLNALGRLQSGVVKLDEVATLSFEKRRVRYLSSAASYAYDGRVLTIVTPGAAYRGSCPRATVIDEVASALGAVDPIARSILVRTAPFSELFPPESKVRLVGTMAAGGQPCDVLQIDGSQFRATVFARKADGLPLSVEATTLDNRGHEMTTTRRALQWSSVGGSLPSTAFAVAPRPGQTVLPLPKRPSTGP